MVRRGLRSPMVAVLLVLTLAGCQTAYYSIWEKLGQEKRDLLRSNVKSMQGEQREAAEDFESALDRLRRLYEVDAKELEAEYDKLRSDQERLKGAAEEIRARADKIETIATDLFAEWERELGEISDAELRGASGRKLAETRAHFDRLAASLGRTEASMTPVLQRLNDHVLFLKHNLNAAAIGGLGVEISDIESDVDGLIGEMNESIAEADRFLRGLPE